MYGVLIGSGGTVVPSMPALVLSKLSQRNDQEEWLQLAVLEATRCRHFSGCAIKWNNVLKIKSVPMDIISDLPFDCYDIGNAVIINSSTEIMRPKSRDQIHILDSGTRRYRDLVATDWNSESSQLSLQAANVARQRLSRLRDLGAKIRPDNQTGVEFVGIYIKLDDSLPFDYFYRAITFQRKLHFARLIFVVICEDPQSALCERIHAPTEEIYVQPMKANNPGYDFALMSLCNHTIISNHMGIFHALNNGGDVVVYEFEQTDVRIRYLPWLLANELDSWYMLA